MNKGMRGFLTIIFLLFAVPAHGKSASGVFDAVSSSIVVIRTYDAAGKNRGFGSGVALASDLIATNCHVIKDAASIEAVRSGKGYSATVRHSDWDRDVCTLTVSGINAPAVVVGHTSRLKVGTRVYAIGAPQGLELTLSEGIISSLRRVDGGHYIQITAAISPGSSGGGLFDEEGRLIGLTSFYFADGQQLNFAVPVEWINELPKHHKEMNKGREPTTIDWLNKFSQLIQRNDQAEKLSYALRWTKVQPGNAYAWLILGIVYADSDQIEKAIEAYQQALSIDAENALAWFDLGFAYGKLGQNEKSIKAFQQALQIDSEDAKSWYNLGVLYSKNDQMEKSIEAYQQALRINPDSADAWHGLGLAYAKSGQRSQVLEVYKRLKMLDPKRAEKFFNEHVLP